jgi:adenine-specific DNA-methyltransferase
MISVPDTISPRPENIHGNPSAPDYLDNPQKQSQVKTLEKQIDQLVYKLYDLNPEERLSRSSMRGN